jgi:hypothetical protein
MVMGMYRADESGQDVGDRFASELMRLKHRGCCVLVTGSVGERVRAMQSRALFGGVEEYRQRVFALTDATPTDQYLPDGLTPESSDVTVLNHTDTVRDVAGVADPSSLQQSASPSSVSAETASVTGFGATLSDSITETIQSGLSPGELRVGVATLNALIAMDGLSATCAFIREIRADLRAAHGMGHVHLPGSPEADALDALRSVVDIHLELRESQQYTPRQRWHLLDADITTNWHPV